jgi:hypothetical protein
VSVLQATIVSRPRTHQFHAHQAPTVTRSWALLSLPVLCAQLVVSASTMAPLPTRPAMMAGSAKMTELMVRLQEPPSWVEFPKFVQSVSTAQAETSLLATISIRIKLVRQSARAAPLASSVPPLS